MESWRVRSARSLYIRCLQVTPSQLVGKLKLGCDGRRKPTRKDSTRRLRFDERPHVSDALSSLPLSLMAFSQSRRQSTMRPPEPPGSARSAIPLPMPTPLAKPQNNKRMSLAGPALRNAMLPPPIPGSVQQGGSLYKSHNMNPLLMSTSKAGVGRTPAACVLSIRAWN